MPKIPAELAALYSLGLNDWKNAESLHFTDFEWIPQSEFGSPPYWPSYHAGLTAFGFSGRRDEWSFFGEWTSPDDPLVIFCGIAGDGYVYARNFREFLIRKTIEEFSVTWLDEQLLSEEESQRITKVDAILRAYPRRLEPILGADTAMSLAQLLAGRTLKVQSDTGCLGYLSFAEEKEAVEKLVGFEWLNRKICHDRNNESRYDGMAKPE